MQTEYKYLVFTKADIQTGKTSIWDCRNIKSNTVLGLIRWHSAWRQYSYFPIIQAVYSGGCLEDIAGFIKQLEENSK